MIYCSNHCTIALHFLIKFKLVTLILILELVFGASYMRLRTQSCKAFWEDGIPGVGFDASAINSFCIWCKNNSIHTESIYYVNKLSLQLNFLKFVSHFWAMPRVGWFINLLCKSWGKRVLRYICSISWT